MIRFSFRKGLIFLDSANGKWTLEKRLFNRKLRLETLAGEILDLTDEELTQRWRDGEWIIDPECLNERNDVFFTATPGDLKSLSETDQAVAKGRLDYIHEVRRSFKEVGQEIVSTVEQLRTHIAEATDILQKKWVEKVAQGDKLAAETLEKVKPPSPATFWRWWNRFRNTQCVTKLVDGRGGHSGRKKLLEQRSVFEEACLEVFLNIQRKPGKAVWDAVKLKYKRINHEVTAENRSKPPSRATVYRWLKELHYGVVLAARMGKVFAERELRAALDSLKVDHILDRVEVDHTPVDVLLICKITKLVLGRPWLTLAIDRKSRMIVGFYISFHAPSAYSVLYCLRMAILPKDHILKKFGLKGRWPARGICLLLVSDNGMELHAEAIEIVTYEMGIEHQYAGVADPEMKGAIERMFRTNNQSLFHQLPGTVFSNPKLRAAYPSEKLACLDLETFTEIFVRWIVDEYHNTPHRGLNGYTPLQVWEADSQDKVIELPAYPEQLETIVAISATRTVFHYGIEIDNLRYNSSQLQTILGASAKKALIVAVRCHEQNVGYVHVQDPETREFFKVPAVKQDYAAGLNRHIHMLVCAETRHRFGDGWRDEQLLDVKAEIQAIVDEAIRAKKMGERKGAAVASALDSEEVLAPDTEDIADALEAAQQPIHLDVPLPAQLPTQDYAEEELPDLVATELASN